MRVWDDKVELWNYGELPYNYTIEKLLQTHESYPRNPLLAQIFYFAGFIEQWGRGYEKIHDAFVREHLMQPSFEQARGGILVTIPREKFIAIQTGKPQNNNTIEENGERTTQKSVQKSVQKIVDFISENPSITTQEMANLLGINRSVVARHIKTLQEKGIIRRVGPDKGGHWEIIKR
jgi:ATP-dependent DNA helicase RecG